MNVGELRKAIEGVADDVIVVMSADSEGNDYSPLNEVSIGRYHYYPHSSWSGDIITNESHVDEDDEDPEPIPEDAVPCVVVWPVI